MTPPSVPLAIVVPCFNEALVIASTIARLRAWFPEALIVVIDDGSADETYRIASEVVAAAATAATGGADRIRVVRQAANGGKGRAVAAAVPQVAGHAVVIADADLAYEEAPMRRAIEALAEADIAIGSRRHPASTYVVPVRLFGFLYRRHILGYVFNLFVRMLLGIDARDTQCGLKAFRPAAFASVMTSLRTSGFAFDLDVLLLAKGFGLRIGEVPVDVTMGTGRSSVRLVRDGSLMLKEVLILAGRHLTGGYSRRRLLPSADERRGDVDERLD